MKKRTPQKPQREEKRAEFNQFSEHIKHEILAEIKRQDMTKTSFAKSIGKEPSFVFRTLYPDNDMRMSTLFTFADALGMKWHVELIPKKDRSQH